MLPKENRLPSSQIKIVMRTGRRESAEGLQLIFAQNNLSVSRFAFVVPKSVDKRAVARNRLKRLARESVRLALPSLASGWDGVFMVRKGLGDELASVNACVRDLLMRSKILL